MHSSRILYSSLALATSFLAAGCSSGSSEGQSAGAATTAASSAAAGSFVKVSGTHFSLDGNPFYFQGTSAARFPTGERETQAQVYSAMQQYAQLGLRVVRIWGFSCRGDFYGQPMVQSAYGGSIQYNEDALKRLDATIDAARAAGLKIVMPLVNFEPAYCGMSFWAKDVIGSNDKQTFYTDGRVKAAFKTHVATMLNRINTSYLSTLGRQIRYADDPTIMTIEVANEPHTEDNYERSRGQNPGDIVNAYLGEMSSYIRGLDSNHLIASGEEGYRANIDPNLDGYDNSWINNGLKGVDFDRDVKLPNIDYATVHLYPDNWNIPTSKFGWVQQRFIQRRADIAHNAGKPIVMEESGYANDNSHPELGYSTNPAYWLNQTYADANAASFAGTMIWQLMPQGSGSIGYDYTIGDAVSGAVQKQAQLMRSLSTGASVQPPNCTGAASLDANGDGWGWENNQSCRVQVSPGPTSAYPVCSSAATLDAKADGWGWENGKSCKVGG